MKAEQALAKFMDRAFYSKLHDKDGNSIQFHRIVDYNLQKKGVDVCVEVQGRRFLIDEKATFYYSNLMIPTFAFEIESIQKNSEQPVEGWLLNDKLATDYYMLIWPNIKCKKQKNNNAWIRVDMDELQEDDFTIIEAMLIKKQRIIEYLNSFDWHKSRILDYAKRLRRLNDMATNNIKEKIPGISEFYFYLSKNLAEQPVNIVIRKDRLCELADANYFISLEKYVEII